LCLLNRFNTHTMMFTNRGKLLLFISLVLIRYTNPNKIIGWSVSWRQTTSSQWMASSYLSSEEIVAGPFGKIVHINGSKIVFTNCEDQCYNRTFIRSSQRTYEYTDSEGRSTRLIYILDDIHIQNYLPGLSDCS